jgi:hypothetical protein
MLICIESLRKSYSALAMFNVSKINRYLIQRPQGTVLFFRQYTFFDRISFCAETFSISYDIGSTVHIGPGRIDIYY